MEVFNRRITMEQDINLQDNDKIEAAIEALQKETTEEMLAHTLTVIRKRMKEKGHLIPAVEQSADQAPLQMRVIQTGDGKSWFAAFTSFDEELKGSNSVMSAFTAEIGPLFLMTLRTDAVEGLIINPWNKTIMLNKNLIRIIIHNYKGE